MIFVTGDTHAGIDIGKLNNNQFKESKLLNKTDYVIIAGDFGFVWDGSRSDEYWLKWFSEKPFTTLFVDGNHENFELLDKYQVECWNGGKVHKINESVIHLMRGQVFQLDNSKIFTFGGAKSSDIEYRKEHVSWWKEEMPSNEEYEEGLRNLEVANWEVDFVITHICSSNSLGIINDLFNKNTELTELHEFFNIIEERIKFKHWYFGHYHQDSEIKDNQTLVFNKIIKLG
jgi:predicted phosphodiesterase